MIKFSKMTGKLDGIPATCTDTTSNSFCQKMQKTDSICASCYSQAMLTGMRKNCKPLWKKHLKILSKPMTVDSIPSTNAKYARFQAHGELTNVQNAINLLIIAEKNPRTTFAFFTKRYKLAQKAIEQVGKPDNVIMIYSSPSVDRRSRLPKYFDKTFTTYSDKNGKYVCKGKKCLQCLVCYDKNSTDHITELKR